MLEVIRPKIVAAGIDSLNIGFNINKFLLDKATFSQLAESKAEAGSKLFGGKDVTVEIAGHEFNMLPGGANGYAYIMHNDDIRLCLAKECQGGKVMPEVFVQMNSVFLWGEGYDRAYKKVRDFVGQLGVIDSERMNRADLCIDLEIALPEIDLRKELVTRARNKADYHVLEHYTDGLRDTGYRFGSHNLMARIYDKYSDLSRTEKQWFIPIWVRGDYDGVSPVTRVEGQFGRQFLKEMSVDNYKDLIERTPDIWRVFTSEFITLRVPNVNDSNRSRWSVSPFWETVQSAGTRFGECQGVERWKQKQPQIEPMMAQMEGLMVSEVALDSTIRGEYFSVDRLKSVVNEYLDSEEFHIKVMERRGKYANL